MPPNSTVPDRLDGPTREPELIGPVRRHAAQIVDDSRSTSGSSSFSSQRRPGPSQSASIPSMPRSASTARTRVFSVVRIFTRAAR